jgi:hypothetical protein
MTYRDDYQRKDARRKTMLKYYHSEKCKKRRQEHPEYKESHFTNSVGRLLEVRECEIKDDPESLSNEFICDISGINLTKKRS